MELTGTFNISAPASGADTGSHSETGAAEGTQSLNTASAGNPSPTSANDNQSPAAAPAPVSPQESNEVPEENLDVNPEVQAINDAQDRRMEENARIASMELQARQKMEAELDRRYGGPTRQLRAEIHQLHDVLDNSGPVRLAWLKLTRQVGRDPELDLRALHTEVDIIEHHKAETRRMFEEGLREQAEARQTQGANIEPQGEILASSAEDHKGMTKEQADERIAYLEANRPKPVKQTHNRPGKKIEQYVHTDEAVRHEREISVLRAFVESPDLPAHERDSEDQPENGLEPSL